MTWKVVGISRNAHSSDIKALARVSNSQFLSAGRDGAVRLWQRGGAGDAQIMEFREHEGFVNSVAFIPSTEEHGSGIIASGGSDKLVNLYDVAEGSLCGALIGHTDNICKLQVLNGPSRSGPFVMASCSWDGSARCWTEELSAASCLLLSPPEDVKGPCWSLLSLGKEVFVTAHADRNLRVWRGDRLVQTIQSAHRDVIRDLLALDSNFYSSVGNDGALKVWDAGSGKPLRAIEGAHPAFIYGLAGNGEDLMASFGEEGVIKIWRWIREEEEVREVACLRVAAMSVWSAVFLDASTLLVGTSNGAIYAFSCEEPPSASIEECFAAELAAFDAALHASKSAEIEKNALDESVLRYPGERVGKVVMVKRAAGGGAVEAHQWDGMEWQNLGEVIDPASVKAPDFNFKVELDDTGRSYSLPYSWGENPYAVAKNFLERNDLPVTHLDEVANFIMKNAGNPPSQETKVSDKIVEPALLIVDAWNAEGVKNKLKSFGMNEISSESISQAIKSWPVDQLFPCLDWLRVEVLKDEAALQMAVKDLPLERILGATSSAIRNVRKEELAAVTMTLRLFCNVTARSSSSSSYDADSIVKVVGKCSQALDSSNAGAWIPLIVGLVCNAHKQKLLDPAKSMALLLGLLTRANRSMLDMKNEAEIDRICWLIKDCGGSAAPLAAAIKKELEARPTDFASKMGIFQ